jgi:hypothetical protein
VPDGVVRPERRAQDGHISARPPAADGNAQEAGEMSRKPEPRAPRRHRFNVGPGSWMERFVERHGTSSSLLLWGRRPGGRDG